MKNHAMLIMATGLVGLVAAGCQPAQPPPDVLKGPRAALTKTRAVEGQVQQQAEERMKAADEAQK